MKKDDDKEKDEQEEISPGDLLAVAATLFGAPDSKKVAKRRKELQKLDSLEYPGGKRVH